MQFVVFVDKEDAYTTFGKLCGKFNGFSNTCCRVGLEHHTVRHYFNRVLELLVELNVVFIETTHFPVYANSRKTFFTQVVNELGKFTFTPHHDRGKNKSLLPFTEL